MSRDKRARFVEIAESRVNRAISQIRLIGNLTNRANYEFDEADARKIVRALQKEVEALRAKFGEGPGAVGAEFRL